MSKHTTLEQLRLAQLRAKAAVDALDTRVGVLEAVDAEHNVIVGIQKNGTDVAVDSTTRKVNITVPTNNNELTNGAGYQTAAEVSSAISEALTTAYKAAGSLAPSGVVSGLLIAANEGKVYNLSGALTLDATSAALFVDGVSGDVIPAGTNIAVVNTATSGDAVYKFDKMAGFIELDGYAEKDTSGTTGNIVKLKADGSYEDAGIAASEILTSHQDISGKADKVSGATSGNFAGLDANGNLTDSGKKASDFATAGHTHADKADKDTDAVEGNFAAFDANGNPVDSGHKHSDYLTAHQDITGKADKVSSPTSGDLAGLDSNGNLTDSGVAAANVMQKVASATAGHIATLNANGEVVDSGDTVATDSEVTAMLDTVWGAQS